MIDTSVEKLAESKLTILYLLDKMDIPMSKGQICQFALEMNYIDYFSLQSYIAELVQSNFIREMQVEEKLIYINTDEGKNMLSMFFHRISDDVKNGVDLYVSKMKNKVRQELETKAHYIHIGDDNYVVTCGIYENEKIILEIKMTFASKKQAVLACKNWREKTDEIYLNNVKNLLGK